MSISLKPPLLFVVVWGYKLNYPYVDLINLGFLWHEMLAQPKHKALLHHVSGLAKPINSTQTTHTYRCRKSLLINGIQESEYKNVKCENLNARTHTHKKFNFS